METIKQFCDRLDFLIEDQSTWSQATFGTDEERGPIGPLKHLEKEAKEAYQAYGSQGFHEELADCFILLLDAIRRGGLSFQGLVSIAQDKMVTNRMRTWPKPTSDEPVEHARDELTDEEPEPEPKLSWSFELPTKEGLYLYQLHTEWPIAWGVVKPGEWQKAENPEWLYVGGFPLKDLGGRASWYGPLPQPPNKVR